ncbi:GNAT family N-acetyltransferase [Flocculibacter collagenilyticus]|uniref:GNAT family N-acetyltransferase n=1 Tax=Flocculibacter collagenilyticus TaxID=2744479 RepID=UPI0018F702A7|nr:GNAT family N-acetyltransferase [Flocculibacter collagenilyticus]
MKNNIKINILEYQPEYKSDFKSLNTAWLTKHFTVEAIDKKVLNNPEQFIINCGGKIWFAALMLDNRPSKIIGCIALKKSSSTDMELTKMAVDEHYQGYGVGKQLLAHVIHYFKQTDYSRLYLESNSKLQPAIGLYLKMGFVHKTADPQSVYQRADVLMEYVEPVPCKSS